MIHQVDLVLNAGNLVGESILWSPEDEALYWVDICGRHIHRYQPAVSRHDTWETPDFPTSIAMRKSGGFLVGLQHQVCFWEPNGTFETFAQPEPELPCNRLNEGRVAPDGSFWVASMQNNLTPDGSPHPMTENSGAIYRIDPDGGVKKLTDSIFGIPNTMVWSGDGRFYFGDTLANELYSFHYDPFTSTLSDRRVFVSGAAVGRPDGSTMDTAERIWNCRFGGSTVVCFDQSGSISETLSLPVTSPTSCTFGGKDLSTLYITSARFGLSEAELAANPIEGGLFSTIVGVAGRPEPKFGW